MILTSSPRDHVTEGAVHDAKIFFAVQQSIVIEPSNQSAHPAQIIWVYCD